MKNIGLDQQYRELDRDLAALYDRIQGWNNEVQTPFPADEETLGEMSAQWKSLQERTETIEAPDRVYAMLRHHFQDFLSTLTFLIGANREHPESAILHYYYIIPKVAWLDDREDELRCQELEKRFRAVTAEEKRYRKAILDRYSMDLTAGDDEAAAGNREETVTFVGEATAVQRNADKLAQIAADAEAAADAADREASRWKEHFPGFTEEQGERLKAAGREYSAFLRRLAKAIADKAAEESGKTETEPGSLKTENVKAAAEPGDNKVDAGDEENASEQRVQNEATTEKQSYAAEQHMQNEAAAEKQSCSTEQQIAAAEEDLSITVKMDPDAYRAVLRDNHGVDLDEMLAWYRDEIEKTRSECFRVAAELNLPGTDPTTMAGVNDILFRFEPPADSGEEMIRRCNDYMKRTRALARRVIPMPEEEQAVCVPIPTIYMGGYPWGGYEGGDFRNPPYIGKMFLNQHNYRNITDGWIKLNALHESYPGHHCQFVRTAADPLPQTVKIGSRLIPLLEGTCLRTETVYGGIFEEDPVFRLFTAYRRHHASVRICVDLMLFYEGRTLQEAVDLYRKELDFDYVTARAQVQAHQNAPGYFTCYYYGLKMLEEWQEEFGWDSDDYTRLLFSAGFISMESFRMLLEMTPEERNRYYCDFPGMV